VLRRLLLLASAIVFIDAMFFAAIVPLLPQFADEFDLSRTGEFGPRLVPPDAIASYAPAEGRDWNHCPPLNSCPISEDPTTLPWNWTMDPLAWSWKAT